MIDILCYVQMFLFYLSQQPNGCSFIPQGLVSLLFPIERSRHFIWAVVKDNMAILMQSDTGDRISIFSFIHTCRMPFFFAALLDSWKCRLHDSLALFSLNSWSGNAYTCSGSVFTHIVVRGGRYFCWSFSLREWGYLRDGCENIWKYQPAQKSPSA